MKPYAKRVGARIKQERLKRGLGQKELAYALGYKCKGQMISNLERGCCNAPTWLLPLLAAFLNVDFYELLNLHLMDIYDCEKYDAVEVYKKTTSEQMREAIERINQPYGFSSWEIHKQICAGN